MKILSLFDGISCARVGLERAGVEIDKYYASEIDKYAIQIAQKNYPDTIQVGDIEELKTEDFTDIDLIMGGSPCQDLSVAGKMAGLKGSRSRLFYDFVRLVKEIKPKYFILENVNSMNKENKRLMTEALFGIEPVMIDAALVSAQNRKRLFWVGKLVGDTYERVEIKQPEDRGILLKDILEKEVDEKYFVKNISPRYKTENPKTDSVAYNLFSDTNLNDKSRALNTACGSTTAKNTTLVKKDTPNGKRLRRLTPVECERLQTLPDNYTEGVSNTQRYKAIGNGWTVDVIAHIFSQLTEDNKDTNPKE